MGISKQRGEVDNMDKRQTGRLVRKADRLRSEWTKAGKPEGRLENELARTGGQMARAGVPLDRFYRGKS